MTKLIFFKSWLVSVLIVPAAFAADTSNAFNQQGDMDYSVPDYSADSYFAEQTPLKSNNRTYLGVNFGFTLTSLKPVIKNSYFREQKLNFNSFSYATGLYGGIGTNIKNFYIGTELSGNYNTLSQNVATTTLIGSDNIVISTKKPICVGLDIIPGYLNQQKNLLFYGRLGIETNLFQFKLRDLTDPSNDMSTSSSKKITIGWRAGVGMEYFMTESLCMRIEYLMSKHKSIENSYIDNTLRTYYYEIPSPTTNQVNIGLTINF